MKPLERLQAAMRTTTARSEAARLMRRRTLLIVVALVSLPRVAWAQGNPVGPEFRVNTVTTFQQEGPSVAADSAGNFVVVWASAGGGIWGQRFAGSGTPLGLEFLVNTYAAGKSPFIASDLSGNFVVVWTGADVDPDGGVFGQRFASSGTPLGPEFRVNTFTTGSQGYGYYGGTLGAASDSSGNFVVVWHSYAQDGSGYGIFGQRFASSGIPLGPEFRVNTYTTSDQGGGFSGGGLAVSSDSSGNFVVVWQSYNQDGSFWGAFGQRYASSGVPLGSEFRVNTVTSGWEGYPFVASDPSGNFVVAWMGPDADLGIFAQRYASSGTPLGPEFRVNTHIPLTQGHPVAAADASGNFVVVWDSFFQDGSSSGVFGQRFASSGIPLGPEFRVNTFTANFQQPGSVAADLLGNFVVVWQSLFQDGSAMGVYGQRYNQIVPVELMHFRVE